MNKRRIGLAMMLLGTLALVAGLGLMGYNLWDNHRAGLQADAALQVIVRHQEEAVAADPDRAPELPAQPSVLEVDSRQYIGTVSIPAIGAQLPVQENWSLELLKAAPCRYMGSPYQGDLIICAHNYDSHFGRLKNLRSGNEVLFTDVDGNTLRYAVAELETLSGTAVEEIESGGWDLTLFTCTLGGQARVTVRCERLSDET